MKKSNHLFKNLRNSDNNIFFVSKLVYRKFTKKMSTGAAYGRENNLSNKKCLIRSF